MFNPYVLKLIDNDANLKKTFNTYIIFLHFQGDNPSLLLCMLLQLPIVRQSKQFRTVQKKHNYYLYILHKKKENYNHLQNAQVGCDLFSHQL